ncbi:hypothetical protein KC669_04470, partial [Candidatus Dojkabacteria bacterium]|nr:hypothetical protein [Candidatus Dojkabacteria bacterium]
MEFVRENLLYIAVAALIVLFLFLGLFSIFNRNSYIAVNSDGEVLGAFEMRQETPSGNLLVSYSYPFGWTVNQNGVTSNIGYFEDSTEQMQIYYVFETYKEKYKGMAKKTFLDANNQKRQMYWEEYTNNDKFYIDAIWPVESLKSSVRFTCLG